MAISIDQLRQQLAHCEGSDVRSQEASVSTGAPLLDSLLDGGLRRGTLIEWLTEVPGDGAASLALACAREIYREQGVLVVADPHQQFYPPPLASWGIDLRRLFILRPQGKQELEWALVQALRSPAVAAIWATLDRIDDHAFRRLQLSAKAGGTLGLLLRPAHVRGQPTWSDVQLSVEPLAGYEPRRVRVAAIRCRGGRTKGSVELELDDAEGKLRDARQGEGAGKEARLFVN